jgi:hypothetical protein
MSHSFDWRCDACERRNQHDFPATLGDGPVANAAGASTVPDEPSREEAVAGAATAAGAERRESEETLECTSCHHRQPMAVEGFDDAGDLRDPIEVCLACGSNRLYSQKDFNRKLGVAIVIVGAAFSPWTYGFSLIVCMGLDYGLYYFVPEITVCYACDAIHRGFEHNPAHRAHDPLLAERFRREARQELGLEELETEAESDEA